MKTLKHKIIKKPRITVYLPSLSGGGAERVMLTLANGFLSDNTRVDLVLANAVGPYLKDISPSIRLIDLHSDRVLKSLPKLICYFRQERPDAVLTAMTHANIIVIFAIWLSRIKTKLVISERVDISGLDKTENLLGRLFINCLMKMTYRYAHKLVAVSRGVASGIIESLKLPADFVDVIYNPVNLKQISILSLESPTHPWFFDGGPPVIIAAGRLSQQKNFSLLINAFSELRKNILARLIIIGEGEDRVHLEALILKFGMEADIQLPGFVENPYSWFRSSSVFVLSSRWEGLPNVLIEAMACGVPVVSTDCPSGPAEILENGKWGKLVPLDGQKEMAVAIAEALRKPKPSSNKFFEKFALETVVAKYRSLLVDDK